MYCYLFFGNRSITHHTTRALEIAALDGRELGFKYIWPSSVPDTVVNLIAHVYSLNI